MSKREEADVIVLGAGVAGLRAAAELSKSLRVIVLEARDRVGGRLFSLEGAQSPFPIELGAEFIHGHMPDTFDLLPGAGLAAYDVADQFVTSRGGRIISQDKAWSAAEKFLCGLGSLKVDCTFAEYLEQHGKHLSPQAKRVAIAFVEGFNAADYRQVSCLSLAKAAAEEARHPDGEKQYRLIGPYCRLANFLAESIGSTSRVVLDSRVTNVRWRKGSVEVLAESAGLSHSYFARACVIALPLGVLQSEQIAFEPELPTRQKLRSGLVMGDVVKVVVRFDEPIWETFGQKDLSFIQNEGAPLPTWWTTLPVRTLQLTGWAGGQKAASLVDAPESAIREAVEQSLCELFPISRRSLRNRIIRIDHHDWHNDPYAQGAYTYARAGYADLPRLLAKPVLRTLYMAGEHTHDGVLGTVASAINSGKRAAKQLLRDIRASSP